MTKRKPAAAHKPKPVLVERPQEPALAEVEVGLPGLSARFDPQRAAGPLSVGALAAVAGLTLLMFGLTPFSEGFARADSVADMVKQSAFTDAVTKQTSALAQHQNILSAQTDALKALGVTMDLNRKEVLGRIVQSNITASWMRYCEAMRNDRIGEADAYRAQISGLQAEYHAYAGNDFPLVPC